MFYLDREFYWILQRSLALQFFDLQFHWQRWVCLLWPMLINCPPGILHCSSSFWLHTYILLLVILPLYFSWQHCFCQECLLVLFTAHSSYVSSYIKSFMDICWCGNLKTKQTKQNNFPPGGKFTKSGQRTKELSGVS